jgi:hypothetical protein
VVFADNIKSLRVIKDNDWKLPPVITLGNDESVEISFDDLKHEYVRYCYVIRHCNSDWTYSDILTSEYTDGFNTHVIDGYEQSMGTKVEYNRYAIKIPNENTKLLASGNYCIQFFEEHEEDSPIAQCFFSVVEPRINISAEVNGNTDIDTYQSHQQISFTINHPHYNIRNPHADIKVVVCQNGRWDNAAYNIKPTYLQNNKLIYTHNKELIFAAGNEYRRFEITDEYVPRLNVESIEYHDPYYHSTLYTDEQRTNYIYDQDQNGKYVIRNVSDYDNDTGSEYIFTHFKLNMPELSGGEVFINGDLVNNNFSEENKMTYNLLEHTYDITLFLKQGTYNYQYLFVPYGEKQGYTHHIEGNFHQTENSYSIYVYHRDFDDRYDKLIGFLEF